MREGPAEQGTRRCSAEGYAAVISTAPGSGFRSRQTGFDLRPASRRISSRLTIANRISIKAKP